MVMLVNCLSKGPALRKIVEQINNEADFHAYVQSYGTKSRKIKNLDIPYDQYNMVFTN
jgi:hypothetical protein